MIAALSTIVFLAVLLGLAAIAAMVVEASGAKVRAALRGVVPGPAAPPAPVRVSARGWSQAQVRARPRLRAAA